MTRLFVTGGSGDLGRVLCERATAAGYDVIAGYWSHPDRIRAGKPLRLDLCDGEAAQAALREYRPDLIIHTAMNTDVPPAAIIQAMQNLHGTIPIIYLSTDMVFDGTNAPYSEESSPAPWSGYGQAKFAAEALASTVVRTSLIYDFVPGNKQVDFLLRPIQQGQRCRLFYDEFRSPIWSQNLAGALLELVAHSFQGVLHVAGPERLSRADLGAKILGVMGYEPQHIERISQAGTNRPPDLTMDVSRAKGLLKTPLLSIDEAIAQIQP